MMSHPVESWRSASAFMVTFVTCAGYLEKDFPRSSGNCFSVLEECEQGAAQEVKEGKDYFDLLNSGGVKMHRIINFCHENFEELLKRKIKFPVKILILRDGCAVLHDERIPSDWYSSDFCTVCTPSDLLPPQQRLQELRAIASGRRTEREIVDEDGNKSVLVQEKVEAKMKKLKVGWTMETAVDIKGYKWAPYKTVLKNFCDLDDPPEVNPSPNENKEPLENDNWGNLHLGEE